MLFKIILLRILLIVIISFTLRVVYGLFAFMFKKQSFAMYVPSFDRHIRLMKNQLKLISWKKLVDLWCGDGKAMRFFSKTFNVVCHGYELQSFPYYYGKILNTFFGYPHITLSKKNFLQVDISGYDYIYVYLLPQQMAAIEDWIFAHMKKDAIIISNSFQFAVHKPYDSIKDTRGKPSIFLYKKD